MSGSSGPARRSGRHADRAERASIAAHALAAERIDVRGNGHEFRRLTGVLGCGIGWIGVQLLAFALLAGVRIWRLDRRLAAVAAASFNRNRRLSRPVAPVPPWST
jgi:hypothetical protein